MDIHKAESIITDDSQHIAKKMRSLFYLRNILTEESASILSKAFKSKSVLLKHEVAYVLGQMRLDISIDTLIKVLDDSTENEIVRHEAGEALGNFEFSDKIYQALVRNMACGVTPVEETCYLAVKKINKNTNHVSKYGSRDPALPFDIHSGDISYKNNGKLNLENVSKIFLDTSECLYKRYQAMFWLRDLGTDDAIHVLGKGLQDPSTLFRHEVSFVSGQIGSKKSVGYLVECIKKESEHEMVRHECAEALGIIGTEECLRELVKYQYSECDILRESVEVAIDLHGYINSNQEDYCEVY
ncbi:hypothetical protein P3W45_001740 [Vairimorpha bombi]|jgi:deoxyhypusine monooxygenase